jgi:hypothetical protein
MYRYSGFMGIASPVPIYTCHVPVGLAKSSLLSLYTVVPPFRARRQRQAVFAADPRLSTQSESNLGPSLVAFALSRGRTRLQVTPGIQTGLCLE